MPKKINEHIQCLVMDSVSSAWDNEENTARDLMSYTITKIFLNQQHFKAACWNFFFLNPGVNTFRPASPII